MQETIHVQLMSQTPSNHGCENETYTTTIPLEITREVAKAAIEEIAYQIAEQVYAKMCNAKGFDPTKSDPYKFCKLVNDPTRDINGNCYCFTLECSSSVIEYIDNTPEWDIEVDV